MTEPYEEIIQGVSFIRQATDKWHEQFCDQLVAILQRPHPTQPPNSSDAKSN